MVLAMTWTPAPGSALRICLRRRSKRLIQSGPVPSTVMSALGTDAAVIGTGSG